MSEAELLEWTQRLAESESQEQPKLAGPLSNRSVRISVMIVGALTVVALIFVVLALIAIVVD